MIERSKEWWLNRAKAEGDSAVGAGAPLQDAVSRKSDKLDEYQQGYADGCASAAHQIARLRGALDRNCRGDGTKPCSEVYTYPGEACELCGAVEPPIEAEEKA